MAAGYTFLLVWPRLPGSVSGWIYSGFGLISIVGWTLEVLRAAALGEFDVEEILEEGRRMFAQRHSG